MIPNYTPGECEVRRCKQEVFPACTECEILLCYDHMVEDVISCDQHGKKKRKTVKRSKTKDAVKPVSIVSEEVDLNMERPENYTVEGSGKEVIRAKKVKSKKQKEAKTKRGLGQEYISRKTKKTVPSKQMGARCRGDTCEKQKRQFLRITDQQRQTIFDSDSRHCISGFSFKSTFWSGLPPSNSK